MNKGFVICCFIISASCHQIKNKPGTGQLRDSNQITEIKPGPPIDSTNALSINTHSTTPQEIIAYD